MTSNNTRTIFRISWVLFFALFLLSLLFFEFYNGTVFYEVIATSVLSVFSALLFFFLNPKIKRRYIWIIRGLTLVVAIAVIVHFVLNSIDFYQVFTPSPLFYTIKLHRLLTVSSILVVQLAIGVLLLLMAYYFPTEYRQIVNKKDIFSFKNIVLLYVSILLISQVTIAIAKFYQDSTQALQNISTSFEDRFTYKTGGAHYYGWIWPYTRFINRHVPEDGIIFIPPQSNSWKMEGNADYLRWFIYPRRTVSSIDPTIIPEKAEYILIALGECSEGDCGWPKVTIPKQKIDFIALIDRNTFEEHILTDTGYEPDTEVYTWGVIKLKK